MNLLEPLDDLVVLSLPLPQLQSFDVAEVAVLLFEQFCYFFGTLLQAFILQAPVLDAHDVVPVGLEVAAHVEDAVYAGVCQHGFFH